MRPIGRREHGRGQMRTLGAGVAGIAAYLAAAFALLMLVGWNLEVVGVEEASLRDPPPDAGAGVIWAFSLGICVLPALVGGAVAGKLARDAWLPASVPAGIWASAQAFVLMNGARAQGAYAMVVLAIAGSFAAALLAGFFLGGRQRATAT